MTFPNKGDTPYGQRVKDYIDQGDAAIQQDLDNWFIRGTGNPNGVAVAGVGAEFVNTEPGGWNGARKWIKTTASGSSGWQVVNAYIPMTTVMEWNASGVYTTGGPLGGNFAPRAGQAGLVQVGVSDGVAAIRIRNLALTADATAGNPPGTMITLPNTFRPLGGVNLPLPGPYVFSGGALRPGAGLLVSAGAALLVSPYHGIKAGDFFLDSVGQWAIDPTAPWLSSPLGPLP